MSSITIEDAFSSFMASRGPSSSKTSLGTSRIDRQLSANLNLRDMSLRISDVVTELIHHYKILTSEKENTSERERTKSIQSIHRNVIPYLQQTSEKLAEAANILAPVAGTHYVHKIQESEKREQILSDNDKKKSPSLLMIEDAVSDGVNNTKTKKKLPLKRKSTRNIKQLPTISNKLSQLNPPADGKQYTKREFFEIMDKYEDGSAVKSRLITQLTSQRLVPQSRSSIYRLIDQYKDGSLNLNEAWKKKAHQNY